MEASEQTPVKALWTGQRFRFGGEVYTVKAVTGTGSHLKGKAIIETEEGLRLSLRKFDTVETLPATSAV